MCSDRPGPPVHVGEHGGASNRRIPRRRRRRASSVHPHNDPPLHYHDGFEDEHHPYYPSFDLVHHDSRDNLDHADVCRRHHDDQRGAWLATEPE